MSGQLILLPRRAADREIADEQHGSKAGQSAAYVGDRLGEKDACDAESAEMRQEKGQRNDDEYLAQEGEKQRKNS